MEKIVHGASEIVLFNNGRYILKQRGEKIERMPDSNRSNFEVNVSGEKLDTLGNGGFEFVGSTRKADAVILEYFCKSKSLSLVTTLRPVPGSSAIEVRNKLTNASSGSIKLTRFSSVFAENIFHNDNEPWYKNDSIKIHICHNKWQGEAQWRGFTPSELGLYPTSNHSWERESFRISSVGSWSTANYYPLVIIENPKRNCTFFCEVEGSHNWHLKLCAYGGYGNGSLGCEASGFDENDGYWNYELKPGEALEAERAIIGLCDGGFEAAAGELVKFKRADSTAHYKNDVIPVIYNVYMNGIWGDPTVEKLLPLINSAEALGCELFVIDGGWSRNQNGEGLGDWLPKPWYDEMPLEKLAEYISAHNMKPGIWLELDTCNMTAYGSTLNDALLKRYGRVVDGDRAFYNFTSAEVREYLLGRIDALYRMGFRYIKNDYNHSTGIGAELDGISPAAGLVKNADAFYAFIDEVREKYPDLIIENCGSGALRDDNKILRRCFVQSTSDQELYLNNPSILIGSAPLMPPEKEGMWSYPYPALFDVRENFAPDAAYIEARRDGRETVFNMVNAMFGTIFLSGRIDFSDKTNLALIETAIKNYKKIREYIPRSLPVLPGGGCHMNESGIYSYGLLSDTRLLLGVWNIGKPHGAVNISLNSYCKAAEILTVYAAESTERHILADGMLHVELEYENTAVFFELKIEK